MTDVPSQGNVWASSSLTTIIWIAYASSKRSVDGHKLKKCRTTSTNRHKVARAMRFLGLTLCAAPHQIRLHRLEVFHMRGWQLRNGGTAPWGLFPRSSTPQKYLQSRKFVSNVLAFHFHSFCLELSESVMLKAGNLKNGGTASCGLFPRSSTP